MTNDIAQHDIEKELIAIAKQMLAETGEPYKREIRLDDALQRHLGIDSLGRAELFQRIEKRFSLALPDRLLANAETLADIAQYIQSAHPTVYVKPHAKIVRVSDETIVLDPGKALTLIDVLLLYAENTPGKPHIYFQNEDGQEEIITYGQLLKSALCVAAHFAAFGLQEGETVAIMLPTHPVFFYVFFGVLLAGGIPVPIYPPFRAHQLEVYAKTESHILKNADVRILVTFDQAEQLSRLLQAFVPSLKWVTTAEELLQPMTSVPNVFKADADHFALIQYTSGSTSDPKGVLLAHRNLLANIRAYGRTLKITPQDVAVSWLPLYHDLGLIGAWLGSLYHGIPLILLTPFSFLNHPERWLWAIHYHRGTLSGAPNFAYELCVRKIDPQLLEGLDLSSWRIAGNGAEKIYPNTLIEFNKKFTAYGLRPTTLTPVYGLAESTVALTISPIEREFLLDHVQRDAFETNRLAHVADTSEVNPLTFVSCGLPIEQHEIRIVDEQGQVLTERTVGNLQFRGPSSMQGYYRNEVATQAVFHDGWFDTGDLAYIANGELYITGRRKDLIIKAGRNLYPVEIEEIVNHVAGIRQGCVVAFGIADVAKGTEKLIVVAETREQQPVQRQAIIEKVNEVIAGTLNMAADHVILVAPHIVPKTSSGKLQRAACKRMYLEGRLGKRPRPIWLQMVSLGAQMVIRKSIVALNALTKLIFTSYLAVMVCLSLIPVYGLIRFSSSAWAFKVCRVWAKFLIRISFSRVTVIGKEHIITDSPLIFAANHASYVDGIVAMSLIPANTRFVGKKELFNVPILRTFMRQLRVLQVDRTDLSKGLEETQQIQEALLAGDSIFIFPEGTFSYAPGLRPFRLGAFKIAADAHVPVCPIALQGTRSVWRHGEMLRWPGSITVTVCQPVMPTGTEWQDVTQLRNAVRAEIAKYCGEVSLDFISAGIVAPKNPEKPT